MMLAFTWGRAYWVPTRRPGFYRPRFFKAERIPHLNGVDYEMTLGRLTITFRRYRR